MLQSQLMFTHYDPSVPVVVAADACNTGIGAVILHEYPNGNRKAIYHSSRTLTEAERYYSQIEKEALALIFAVTKLQTNFWKEIYSGDRPSSSIIHLRKQKGHSSVYSKSIAEMGVYIVIIRF